MIRRQAIVRLLTEITALVLTWGGGSLSHGTPCQGTWLPIDGPDFSNSHSIEVYYPPYWHRATRPAIDVTSLPLSQSYSYSFALSFKVQVNPSATVDRIALLRNGANTHAFDMDQRYVELQQTAPPRSRRCPVVEFGLFRFSCLKTASRRRPGTTC